MTSGAGFLQRITCPDCGQAMSPANLGKHRSACAETRRFGHLFSEPMTSAQMKSFRRNLETYNMSAADYAALFQSQGGLCAICRKEDHVRRRLSVDHCHETGRVRGLLCDACNKVIGMAEEDAGRLRSAAAYVTAHHSAAIEASESHPLQDSEV